MRMVAKESEIQAGILELLAVQKIFAARINTGTAKIGKRFFRAHSFGPGCADILAFPLLRRGRHGLRLRESERSPPQSNTASASR